MPHSDPHGSDNYVALGLVGSCFLSLVASLTVIASYARFKLLRRHPSGLICTRALADLVFCAQVITSNISWLDHGEPDSSDSDCIVYSALTQTFAIAAEGFLLMLSLDLVLAITNPFTNYKVNFRRYQVTVWLVSIVSALCLILLRFDNEPMYGRDNFLAICWIAVRDSYSSAFVLLFTGPLMLVYAVSLWAVVFASRRLRRGLPETYHTRMGVFRTSARYVVGYLCYWTIVGVLYVASVIMQSGNVPGGLTFALAIALGCRGIVTLAIWFWTHDLAKAYHLYRTGLDDSGNLDLRPDLNIALRREMIFYSTLGIIKAVNRAASFPDSLDSITGGYNRYVRPRALCTTQSHGHDSVILGREREQVQLSMVSSVMKGRSGSVSLPNASSTYGLSAPLLPPPVQHPRGMDDDVESLDGRRRGSSVTASSGSSSSFEFKDYAPHTFRQIRALYGIADDEYCDAFRTTARERFSEGASGAFMYFAARNMYLVKTVAKAEAQVLLEILPYYLEHLQKNPHSLVSKFLGCYSLKMYRVTLYFVVMENVLFTPVVVHERYDLKGSWIDRHRAPVSRGQRMVCRQCHNQFLVGDDSDMCPDRPNRAHEPNVILKDSDLNLKLRLDQTSAELLANQIRSDCEFLRSMKIMDYSLLLGVHRAKYKLVEQGGILRPALGAPLTSPTVAQLERVESRTGMRLADDNTAMQVQARRRTYLRRQMSSGTLTSEQVLAHKRGRSLHSSLNGRSPQVSVAGSSETGGSPDSDDDSTTFDDMERAAEQLESDMIGAGRPEVSVDSAITAEEILISNTPPAVRGSAGPILRTSASSGAAPSFFKQHHGGLRPVVVEGPGIYFVGIIDLLQKWDMSKRLEWFFKVFFLCKDRHGISAVHYNEYASRFYRRVACEIIDNYEELVERPNQ